MKSRTFTVYVTDTRPGPDYKGEKIVFDCQRDALVYMWAEAKRENPRRTWLFAFMDGWETNDPMRESEHPADMYMTASIRAETERLNALEFNIQNDREITVKIVLDKPGAFSVHCPQMRFESTVHEHRLGETLSHLYYEYQSICEAGL